MARTTGTPVSRHERGFDPDIRSFHQDWLRETREFLEPALEPGADFWTRWAAVRYLADEFRERYWRERALIESLRGQVSPEVMDRLLRGGDRVFRLRLELDRVGRRRGTGAEVAAATRNLLEQLGVWCAEVEFAALGPGTGAQ